MNCPNCGAPEKVRIRICPQCNHPYASQDLQELRQLEFLLAETESWRVPDSLRGPYQQRVSILLENLGIKPFGAAEPQSEPAVTEPETPEQANPFIVTNSKTGVYSGPGTSYKQLGFANKGKKGEVLGVSQNGSWWLIKVPQSASPDGQGWISASMVSAHNTQAVPVVQAPSVTTTLPREPVAEKPQPIHPAPPKEKVPFDQWLLSERNIKIALYSGGLLLLLAGIIFIGVNWTRIPGPGKFAITLLVTGLMYLGGYLLFQRPPYRIGGVALLGIASGFFVLNFAVLQIYVMGPRGVPDNVMWLIASPFCLLLYVLTAYWTKSDLFTFFSLFALGSTLTAAILVAGGAESIYPLVFAGLALVLSILGRGLRKTTLAGFTCQPITIATHVVIPVTFLWALGILGLQTGILDQGIGSEWIALAVLVLGTAFYMLITYWNRSQFFTYLSLGALAITITAALALANAPALVFLLCYALISLTMFVLARGTQRSPATSYISYPLLVVSNFGSAITYLATLVFAVEPYGVGNPWFTLPILGIGLAFYLMSTYWSHHSAFTYASLLTFAGLVFVTLFLLEVPLMAYPITYALFALACLFLARILQSINLVGYTRFPLLSAAHVLMPLSIFAAGAGWIFQDITQENPWLSLTTLGLAVMFYISTDVLYKRLEARWVAVLIFPILLGLSMFELEVSFSSIAITYMILAILYMGTGYAIAQKEERNAGGWPLYATAYILSVLVTIVSIPYPVDLAKILFADVVILAASAAIHQDYWWVYGAAWLLMLPVYLTISLYIEELPYRGLLMGLLGLNYVVAGYLLGRRKLELGAPFLTAAAFLSVVTVVLAWSNPITATCVMLVSAGLYFLAAYWLGWSWMLFPGLILLDLIVFSINIQIFTYQPPVDHALLISYTTLGVVFTLAALALRRTNRDRWSWPLYTMGALNLCGSYAISFVYVDWLTLGTSTVLAILLFAFAWLEREFIAHLVRFPLLTYLGVGVAFIGHYLLLVLLGTESNWEQNWPAYTAGLCAVLVVLAWLLKRGSMEVVYSIPLRWGGIILLALPLMGSLAMAGVSPDAESAAIIVAAAYGIAGLVFAGDAAMRHSAREVYSSLAAFLVVLWAVLFVIGITEPQAYLLPTGLVLLGIGWYEGSRGSRAIYMLLTYTGLILLMGSAFVQSIPRGAYAYALLLGIECLIAIGWGIRTQCRCYVQVGGLALLANAIVQLGPGFIDLPRWIQIGLTGAILLGAGMAALFRREQILNTRRRVTDQWRQWNP